ncbi:BON1-associated protein 2-like [Benincasa hispida]|uniref:BON1-associated protein 2-like n=1 Tax=Benincasa hispida TaxID=102211 RepID=UPI0019012F71|nr:BON1-associated protein 2-like [Benincasa hispida]
MASPNFASRTIEITVISGENLQIRGKPINSDLFVSVRSDLQTENGSVSTKVDRDSAGFPRWNENLVVDLPMHAAFLVVEVCRRASSGRKVKIVGTARVPVADFIAGYLPESHLQFLSYRLRDERGEKNGIVNLSVRVKVAAGIEVSLSQKQGIGVPVPVPMPERKFHGGGGFVTGIPIWNVGYRDRF